jgi:acyl carrier protein
MAIDHHLSVFSCHFRRTRRPRRAAGVEKLSTQPHEMRNFSKLTFVHSTQEVKVTQVELAERRILEFIRSELMVDGGADMLSIDSQLLNGVVDSLGLMQLVAFLEEEFEIEVDDSDISKEYFSTVGDIGRLVGTKTGQG